jgi:hypothetical protein
MQASRRKFTSGAGTYLGKLRKPPWVLRRSREILFSFLVVCIYVNYELDPVLHVYLSQVATVALFAVACLGWYLARRHRVRQHRPRHWNLFYLTAAAYLVWRLAESRQDIWFLGDCGKLVILVLAVTAFWIFGQTTALFPYMCRVLPPMLALAIAISIVHGDLSGALLSHRLRVPELGYAPGLAFVIATTLALHLYSLAKKPRLLWYAVLIVLLVGQILAFQKNGVLAATIILLCYLRNQTMRLGHKVTLALTLGVAALFVITSSLKIEGFHLNQRFTSENVSYSFEGREQTWRAWINQATEQKAILFGVGLGAIKPVSQGTGYFLRDPHSVYVGMLVDFGVVGLALYCGLLVAFWKRIGEDPDNLRRALVRGLFWAYVATGFFDTYWRHSQISWYVGFLFYLFITPRGQVVAAS